MTKIAITTTKKHKGQKFGARKYAAVPSDTRPGIEYVVVKVRLRGESRHYAYRCTCPDFMFRSRQCKHIHAFKAQEQK